MGVAILTVTIGIAAVAIFFIFIARRKKTMDKFPDKLDVVEKKTGNNEGLYD